MGIQERADLGMAWAVRSSFVAYVSGSGGTIELADGAAMTDAGEFYFPPKAGSVSDRDSVLGFRGSVRFRAHFGMLDVLIADPTVRLEPDRTATLSVDTGNGMTNVAVIARGETIREAGVTMWLNSPTSLTEMGAELFGGSYDPGESMATLTIRVPHGPA
jgi:hypothetical protein